MKKRVHKKIDKKGTKSGALAYRIRCRKTANGLSHYVPAEKKSLV